MYKVGDKVRHIKTGGEYEIVCVPSEEMRLEHNNETFYAYKGAMALGPCWHRSKSEMEDGRFEPVD